MENAENFSREDKLLWDSICNEIENRSSLVEFLDEMILKENSSYMEVQHTDKENNVNSIEFQHSSSQNNYMIDEDFDYLLQNSSSYNYYMTEEDNHLGQNSSSQNCHNDMTEEHVDNLRPSLSSQNNYMTDEDFDYLLQDSSLLNYYMTEQEVDNSQHNSSSYNYYMTEEDNHLCQNSSSEIYLNDMTEEHVNNLRPNLSSLNDYMTEDEVDNLRQKIDDLIAYCQDTSKGAEAEIARIKIAISAVQKALTNYQVEPTYLRTVEIGLMFVELFNLHKGLPKNRPTIQPEPHLPTMISPDSEMPLDLRKYKTTKTEHAQTHH